MVDFVNPGVLGPVATFRRVFQTPIERSRDKSATPAEHDLGEARSTEVDACVPCRFLPRVGGLCAVCDLGMRFHHVLRACSMLSRCSCALLPCRLRCPHPSSPQLSRVTSAFLLRRTSSILHGYLPPKIEAVVFVHLSAFQRDLYTRMLASSVTR